MYSLYPTNTHQAHPRHKSHLSLHLPHCLLHFIHLTTRVIEVRAEAEAEGQQEGMQVTQNTSSIISSMSKTVNDYQTYLILSIGPSDERTPSASQPPSPSPSPSPPPSPSPSPTLSRPLNTRGRGRGRSQANTGRGTGKHCNAIQGTKFFTNICPCITHLHRSINSSQGGEEQHPELAES